MTGVSRRVVLTGCGVLTSIGKDPDSMWQALRSGRAGIAPVRGFDTSGLPVRFAGEIPDFNAVEYIAKSERKGLRVMHRTTQLAVVAAQLALTNSRVDKNQLDPARFGVNFGAGLMASELNELAQASQLSSPATFGAHPAHQTDLVDLQKWGEQSLPTIPPLWMLKYLPNMLACHVSILHNAQGPNNTITENEVASLLALGEAYGSLRRDNADFFLVGGAESKLNPLSMVRLCLFEILSKRNDAPEKACRPFDRQRDGAVLGEGAGVFVLEELEHARRRDATIAAEIVGFGAAFDRKRNGMGLARAIRSAMTAAGIGPDQIDHINAHGLSTPSSDRREAQGLREAFGDALPPVFAPKSYFGSLGAGGSLTELAASVLALKHGETPPTLNHEHPDPECPVPVLTGSARPVTKNYVLKVSFTQLGQCAVVVLRRWQEN